MRKFVLSVLSAVSAVALPSAASAIVIGGTNVDLSSGPFTFGLFPGSTFTLSFAPQGSFDFNPVSVRTTGTAAVTAFGGFLGIPLEPSASFPRANASFGPDSVPGFASFTTAAVIDGSATPSDLGLRFSIGSDNFYGYARFTGALLESYGIETQANTAIRAGSVVAPAVPEPAAWAMMISGFGLVGGAMRRRPAATRATA